jgi:ABC-type phosphate transport system substrate-binding protein
LSANWKLTLAGLCFAVISAGSAAGSAKDSPAQGPLAVIVHKSSAVENISISDLRKMLTGDLRGWPDSSPVVVIQQPDESATQQRVLRLLLKTTPAAYNRQLLQIQFQGRQMPVIRVLNSDANAIGFVWNVPGAISIVDAAAATASSSHVKVLKVDGKLPGDKGYPLQ